MIPAVENKSQQSIAPASPTDDNQGSSRFNFFSVPGTTYINALPEAPDSAIAIGVLVVNRRTEEEQCLDILVENDRIATVLKAVHHYFNCDWSVIDTWPIE